MKKRLLFIIGTRPEAIKMAPLIKKFRTDSQIETFVCNTGQHKEMTDEVLNFFKITQDFKLNLMMPNQTLFDITTKALLMLKNIYEENRPDIVFVQGDTTSVFAAALAAYYKKIKIAHIEAGLRTHNKFFPFPEEINRKLQFSQQFHGM